jgi:hypothetical protein
METKDFERTINFQQDTRNGVVYPIITAEFLTKLDVWIKVSLLFDTGATDIVLSREYLKSFNRGKYVNADQAGHKKSRRVPTADSRIRTLGVEQDCTVLLSSLPPSPLYTGLFGRRLFSLFGFGFWENVSELYVTLKP